MLMQGRQCDKRVSQIGNAAFQTFTLSKCLYRTYGKIPTYVCFEELRGLHGSVVTRYAIECYQCRRLMGCCFFGVFFPFFSFSSSSLSSFPSFSLLCIYKVPGPSKVCDNTHTILTSPIRTKSPTQLARFKKFALSSNVSTHGNYILTSIVCYYGCYEIEGSLHRSLGREAENKRSQGRLYHIRSDDRCQGQKLGLASIEMKQQAQLEDLWFCHTWCTTFATIVALRNGCTDTVH